MLDPSKPVYQRLRDLIATGILEGRWAEGESLPSVRALAADYGANPLTVAKAYQSFQDEGLVTVKRGVGMFVADGAVVKLRDQLRSSFMRDVWPPVAEQIRLLDIDMSALLGRVEA